ncbi:MAG: hypothetical protein GXO74_12585 [Calditrichaeota bacterium]|nr:hypothetical protein [Calditrichota bacterium]
MSEKSLDLFFLILTVFLGASIVLQIIIAKRLNAISRRLFKILFELQGYVRKTKQKRKYTVTRTCATCKYRVPFFNLKKGNNDLVYYRCRLTNRKVASEFVCEHFVLDSQQKGA